MEQNATEPIFNTEHYIQIRKGRHPLLDKKKAVPIDARLGKDFDLLVITGPNTGGKTVSLKTVGLFTLMGQAGLRIPATGSFRTVYFFGSYTQISEMSRVLSRVCPHSLLYMTRVFTFCSTQMRIPCVYLMNSVPEQILRRVPLWQLLS